MHRAESENELDANVAHKALLSITFRGSSTIPKSRLVK